jgi:hypothetical protein
MIYAYCWQLAMACRYVIRIHTRGLLFLILREPKLTLSLGGLIGPIKPRIFKGLQLKAWRGEKLAKYIYNVLVRFCLEKVRKLLYWLYIRPGFNCNLYFLQVIPQSGWYLTRPSVECFMLYCQMQWKYVIKIFEGEGPQQMTIDECSAGLWSNECT